MLGVRTPRYHFFGGWGGGDTVDPVTPSFLCGGGHGSWLISGFSLPPVGHVALPAPSYFPPAPWGGYRASFKARRSRPLCGFTQVTGVHAEVHLVPKTMPASLGFEGLDASDSTLVTRMWFWKTGRVRRERNGKQKTPFTGPWLGVTSTCLATLIKCL